MRRAAALLLAALLLPACTARGPARPDGARFSLPPLTASPSPSPSPSPPAPPATCRAPRATAARDRVRVAGCVVGTDGRPVPGARVTLVGEPGFGEAILGLFGSLVTMGLVCVVGGCPDGGAASVSPRADGGFLLDLPSDAAAFDVSRRKILVTVPSTGVTVVRGIDVGERSGPVTIRPIPVWDPRFAVAPGRGGPAVTFRLPPESWRPGEEASVVAYDANGEVFGIGARPGDTIDARLLADHVRSLAVRMTASPHGDRLTYTSRAVPYAGRARPLSRGARCTAVDVKGNDLNPGRRCRFTDGRLGFDLDRPDEECAWTPDGSRDCRMAVTVDLGAARPVAAAFAYGSAQGTLVETSLDGRAWTAAVELVPYGSELRGMLPAGTVARFVRFRLFHDFMLSEVWVFG